MNKEIRFGNFLREVSLKQQKVTYNDLTPKLKVDEQGKEIPYHPPKLQLRPSMFTACSMMKTKSAPQCCQRTRGFNTPWDDRGGYPYCFRQ